MFCTRRETTREQVSYIEWFICTCLFTVFVHLTWDNTDAFPVNLVKLDRPRPTAMSICYIDDVTNINYKKPKRKKQYAAILISEYLAYSLL